ncbi:hypothetical protein Dsin_023361 [Dipteronia sinensis]|uniref:Cytochrome P450 n=1 Tax=Dipteronia sinensis TaxID=43782 RepID=A0AAE0E0T5_9ROSI|nr:hypothetical protein Dsin_023361 [Dipteronia sinensis]
MELQFPSLTFIFGFLVFCLFMAVKIVHLPKTKNSSTKMPPGPWRLPLIGNIHQLVGSPPHHRLRDLAKKYGPLMHLQLGESSIIVVSSAEIAEEVLKTHGIIFANRPSLVSTKITTYDFKNIASAPYGNYWRQLRKICTAELLSTSRVKSFRSIRDEETSNLIKTIYSNEGGLPVNLSKKIFELTYGITARAAFGKKCKDQQKYISIVMEMLLIASGFSIGDLFPSIGMLDMISGMKSKLEKLHQEQDRILENILDEHKERKRTTKTGQGEAEDDLVDVFLRLQQDVDLEFPLTNNSIKAVIADIFTAGSDTSSTTVEWVMSEMLKNPRAMKDAQAEVRRVFDVKGKVDETGIHELKFLKAVIIETLRLHPAAPLVPRENSDSCQINRYEIPTKTRTIVNTWAIGRDPKYWTEAEKFIPERFLESPPDYKGTNFSYIPFGAGRRICPGIQFAIPNIELPLAQMLYHFDWKLPNGMKEEDLDMTEAFGLTLRRKNDLMLIPIPIRPYFDIK